MLPDTSLAPRVGLGANACQSSLHPRPSPLANRYRSTNGGCSTSVGWHQLQWKCERSRNETIDIAVKAFELSQSLRSKWVAADYAAKRRILEIVCLNCSLDDVNLCATMRKPFDLLAKGLVSKDSRGDKI